MSDFQTATKRASRKLRQCFECQGLIEPGEQYERCAGSWDGRMDYFSTCMPCVEIRDWATKQPEWCGDGDHLYYFGMLEEELSNLAPEIEVGDGRKFRAYRLQHQMVSRRKAATGTQWVKE